MKIKKLKIENFRGISFAEIDIESFTTLIGPNNIGKSTILHALHILLDNKKPKLEDWPGQTASDQEMKITCHFHEIQEWEAKKPAISSLLYNNELQINLTCSWNNERTDYTYKYSVYCAQEEIHGDNLNFTKAKLDPIIKAILSKLSITTADEYKLRKEDIRSQIKIDHPELASTKEGWHIKEFANSLQQAIPHVMYVPASFKIEDDLKATNSSPFSFLFNNKLFPKVKDDDTYKEYISKSEALQKKLKSDGANQEKIDGLETALEQISKTLNQVLDFDSKIRLAIGDIDIEPLFMKAATLLINEEIETSLQYQGSGVQRALAYAILESNADIECVVDGGSRTVVVLYEEPELYIHPHLMRRLKDTLKSRSESERWQIIFSTHSPFLINIADNPGSLKLIRRDSGNKRVVHQINPTNFSNENGYDERSILRAALDFHPSVCESLFAKRVILVEGDTELAFFSMAEKLSEKLSVRCPLIKDTSIVSAGGKWTIPAIARVLNELKIDYKIIHDEDRKSMSNEELAQKPPINPFHANKKISDIAADKEIYVVKDTFEDILWSTADGEKSKSSDKPYNSWLRINAYLNDEISLSKHSLDCIKEILDFSFGERNK